MKKATLQLANSGNYREMFDGLEAGYAEQVKKHYFGLIKSEFESEGWDVIINLYPCNLDTGRNLLEFNEYDDEYDEFNEDNTNTIINRAFEQLDY